jgi:hypothetical protein
MLRDNLRRNQRVLGSPKGGGGSAMKNTANADSFTLVIGAPEPSTWAMMALGFGLLGGAGYYWSRRVVSIPA